MRFKPMNMEWLKSRTNISEDGCWIWDGCLHKTGYGETRRGTKRVLAHRQAFFIANGYMPNICRHTCDVRACCNPDHLIDGTHADNVRDRDERGRGKWNKGSKHAEAIFKDEDIARIREMRSGGMSQQAIADEMGCHQTTISRIVRGASGYITS